MGLVTVAVVGAAVGAAGRLERAGVEKRYLSPKYVTEMEMGRRRNCEPLWAF